MLKALPTIFPSLLGTSSNPAIEFYNKFQRAADDHDRDFIKKYDEDLNSTLIFVSIFLHTSQFLCEPHFWNRLVYSPQSHLLSLLMFKASSNQTLRK